MPHSPRMASHAAGWPLTTSTLRGRSWDIFLTVQGQLVARDARTGTLTTIARYDGTGNRLSSLIGEWAVDILSLQQKMLAPPPELAFRDSAPPKRPTGWVVHAPYSHWR